MVFIAPHAQIGTRAHAPQPHPSAISGGAARGRSLHRHPSESQSSIDRAGHDHSAGRRSVDAIARHSHGSLAPHDAHHQHYTVQEHQALLKQQQHQALLKQQQQQQPHQLQHQQFHMQQAPMTVLGMHAALYNGGVVPPALPLSQHGIPVATLHTVPPRRSSSHDSAARRNAVPLPHAADSRVLLLPQQSSAVMTPPRAGASTVMTLTSPAYAAGLQTAGAVQAATRLPPRHSVSSASSGLTPRQMQQPAYMQVRVAAGESRFFLPQCVVGVPKNELALAPSPCGVAGHTSSTQNSRVHGAVRWRRVTVGT